MLQAVVAVVVMEVVVVVMVEDAIDLLTDVAAVVTEGMAYSP